MSTITTILSGDSGAASLIKINTNESNLNTDKQEKGTGVTGNIATFGASNVLGDSGKVVPTGTIVGTTDAQILTNKTINAGSDVTGDVLVRSAGGAVTRVAPAASGSVLQSNGAGVLPSFQAPSFATSSAVQNQSYSYAADTGVANAYVITLAPVPGSLVAGQRFAFKAVNANATASTLNVNSLGVTAIKKNGSLALVAGDIVIGQIVDVEYDGTNFQMTSSSANVPQFKVGTASYVNTNVSAAQNIAHGLGIIPKFVRLTMLTDATGGTSVMATAIGVYNGTTAAVIYNNQTINTTPTSQNYATGTTFVIGTTTNNQTASITFDATNIILTWVKTGAGPATNNGNILMVWEAQS